MLFANAPATPVFLDLQSAMAAASGFIVTINMQHLYESERSVSLRETMFRSPQALFTCDGRGAQLAFRFLCGVSAPIVPGNILLEEKLKRAAGGRVLVIGTSPEILAVISERFSAVAFTHEPARLVIEDRSSAEAIAERIVRQFGTDWTFVALALGVPKQELLAAELTKSIDAPMLCIGGSFEMLAGRLPRAPRLIQLVGLEGVWRLLLQPGSARWNRLIGSYGAFFRYLVRPAALRALIDPPATRALEKVRR